MVSSRRVVAAVALVVLVAAAGYIYLDINGDGPGDVVDRYEGLQDYRGEMVVDHVITGTEEREWVQEVFDNGTVVNRTEPVAGDELDVRTIERRTREGNRTFRIRTVRWHGEIHNRTTLATITYAAPDHFRFDYRQHPDRDLRHALIAGENATLYYSDGRTRRTTTAELGIETVGLRYADVVDGLGEGAKTERVGEATVAGRRATVYNVTAADGGRSAFDRLWIAEETGLPVRVRRRATAGGDTVTTTVTYRNMSYDVGVGEGAFSIDPDDVVEAAEGGPTEAGGVSTNVTERRFDAIAPAEQVAGFTAREPTELPNGFSFSEATVRLERQNASLRIRYGNGSAWVTAVQTPNGSARLAPPDGSENATVGDTEGRYVETDGGGRIVWECDGFVMAVSGDVGRDELTTIASSVPC